MRECRAVTEDHCATKEQEVHPMLVMCFMSMNGLAKPVSYSYDHLGSLHHTSPT